MAEQLIIIVEKCYEELPSLPGLYKNLDTLLDNVNDSLVKEKQEKISMQELCDTIFQNYPKAKFVDKYLLQNGNIITAVRILFKRKVLPNISEKILSELRKRIATILYSKLPSIDGWFLKSQITPVLKSEGIDIKELGFEGLQDALELIYGTDYECENRGDELHAKMYVSFKVKKYIAEGTAPYIRYSHRTNEQGGHKESVIISCPDCGGKVSRNAEFCPHCGHKFEMGNGMVDSIQEGDTIQIEVNNIVKQGVVLNKANGYLSMRLMDNTIYNAKYSVISTLLIIKEGDNRNHKSVGQDNEEFTHIPSYEIEKSELAKQVKAKLLSVLYSEGINTEEVITTNARLQEFEYKHIVAITDGGKTIQCLPPVGFKKKDANIGDRMFCIGNFSKTDICYSSIMEMSYSGLIDKLEKAIHNSRLRNKPNPQINTISTYFIKRTYRAKESFDLVRDVKLLIDDFFVSDDISLQKKNTTLNKEVEIKYQRPSQKPIAIEEARASVVLMEKMPLLSEKECRTIEKELDTLVREGKREECLAKSYEVIATKRPTPKYLRSYLDRVVNTEIALGHTEQALKNLSTLISLSESQGNTKPNTLSHLYISLARLLKKMNERDEVAIALDWAIYLQPKNTTLANSLRRGLENTNSTTNNTSLGESIDEVVGSKDVVISGMLFQDVEQFANSQDSLDAEDASSPQELYDMAVMASVDATKTFEARAQLFLIAAAAYYNDSQKDAVEFKLSIAHYARMKGNSLLNKIGDSVQSYPDSSELLISECDSARSYYLEALGLYNDLELKRYLHELLLKYLKIESLASQIDGGKTPDADWNRGTLEAKMKECLNDYNIESQKVLYRACIAIGSSSESAWNTLASDNDGTGIFYEKLRSVKFREKAYRIINTMEKSSIDSSLAPEEFLRKIFDNRQSRIKDLKKCIEECLSWDFSPFDMSSFEEKWISIDDYKDLMTTTDKLALSSISEVINILKPYAGRKENERYRNLVSSQQILLRSQHMVTETTTYYGRILFFHLQEKWLKEISRQIEEKDASALPQLQISPEPCYIKLDDEGRGTIDFVITNNGDSTAQSFVINALINGMEYAVSHNEELSAGDSCGESIASTDLSQLKSADVLFKLTAKYQGKDLPTIEVEATYEQESGDVLTDNEQIPWKISNTPRETIFKGREGKLSTLISHYLSKDRYMTYILYGLTRTGKTSILDYLCERIEGKHIKEDDSKIISTFKWTFDEKEFKNIKRSDLWANLIETRIYDKLSDELADAVDSAYPEKGLPPADQLTQSDLEIVIDALNKCNIIPLIAIDEFSYVRKIIEEGLLDTTFLKKLRDISYSGKACFLYAGTYDIKDIPKEYGLTGEMNNTLAMPINEIEENYANELIDVCPKLHFDEKARGLIRSLSGCVPYWIQWICLNCGKFAVAQKRCHLGYNEVNYIVKVMTGETQPGRKDTWQAIDEINFYNNQIDPNNIAEHQLISSISYLIRESTHIERGVSMDELNSLWNKYDVEETIRRNMVRALTGLEERRIVRQFTDETREVYRLNVDLFRRWWYVHHRDLKREFLL